MRNVSDKSYMENHNIQ